MALRNEVYQSMVNSCCAVFGKKAEELSEATEFEKDLQAKSVNLTMILNRLEDEFDVMIPFMKFRKYKTIGEAVDFVVELIEG